MPYNIRIASTYLPRRCGIGTFSRDLATALAHFTVEVGHIRVGAIATRFRYAQELPLSNRPCPEGLIIGRYARGTLVDPGEPSVEQMAQAIDFLIFNEHKRLRMERQAHQRGCRMRWNNSAWALLQSVDFIREEKEIVTGRGPKFVRERPSRLDIHRYKRIQVAPAIEAVTQEPKELAGSRR